METVELRAAAPSRINLDYLELFCRSKEILIACGGIGDEMCISPFGIAGVKPGEVDAILEDTNEFELIPLEEDFEIGYFVSRRELESQLGQIVN